MKAGKAEMIEAQKNISINGQSNIHRMCRRQCPKAKK